MVISCEEEEDVFLCPSGLVAVVLQMLALDAFGFDLSS